jgi:Sulfotransferase family
VSERILVAGLPRSGTTWVGQVLGRAGARYVHEPDNHLVRPEAWRAKRGWGANPAVGPEDEAPELWRLWAVAFAGGPRPSAAYATARLLHRIVPRTAETDLGKTGAGPAAVLLALAGALAGRGRPAVDPPGPVVVKSVHSTRSLEWLAARFDPHVVVLDRHPFAIIASWAALGWTSFLDREPAALRYSLEVLGVSPPAAGAAWIERAAWHYGVLASYLRRSLERHPGWEVVSHEALCADPVAGFTALCDRLALPWTEEAHRFLLASNRPGHGYSTNRLWAEQVAGGRDRLSAVDRERVLDVLAAFPGLVVPPSDGGEDHQRDVALGLALIGGVAGVLIDDPGPQRRLLLRAGRRRPDPDGVSADLDGGLRVGDEVAVPLGHAVVAPEGGDHDPTLPVGEVAERSGAELAALAAGGGQQQHGHAAEPGAHLPARPLDDLGVDGGDAFEQGVLDLRVHVHELTAPAPARPAGGR